jgi:pyruvate dehydrogenase E1 component alpha subunit
MAQGLLYECLNLAALWQLPVVFVCENNGYAVSLKVSDGLAGTVTSRADSCGIPSTVVDGMDVRAVRAASAVAVDRARNGGGPSFVECITYRYAGHHTAEASLKLTYRTPEEIQQWRDRDPLLLAREWLPATEADRIDAEVETEMEHAVAFGRASQAPDPASAMDFMYVVGNDRVRGVMG